MHCYGNECLKPNQIYNIISFQNSHAAHRKFWKILDKNLFMPVDQILDSLRLLYDKKLNLTTIYIFQKIILLSIKMIKEENFKGKQLN